MNIEDGMAHRRQEVESARPARAFDGAHATRGERLLWQRLRRRQLGVSSRRQVVIDRFIVDFFCWERALVIEVDGGVHDNQVDRDAERDRLLRSKRARVLRVRDEDVIANVESVLRTTRAALER